MTTLLFRCSNLAILAILAAAASPATAGLIVDFRFEEPAGTPMVSTTGGATVTDSVSGYVFTANTGSHAADLELVRTDGAGVLRPSLFTNGNFRDGRITLAAGDQINATQNSPAQMVVVFAPWSFGAFATGDQELVRFGFGGTSATNVLMGVTLRRAEDDSVTLQGISSLADGVETSLFGNVQTEPVTVILDVDKVANTASVSYQIGAGPIVALPGNQGLALDPARNGNFGRLTFDEPFVGDDFGIDRLQIFTNVPEPTTLLLATAMASVLISRRRHSIA
jgi:hypothetical protein